MGYQTTEIGTLRFLAANIIYQATQAMLGATDEQDGDVLNDAVLMMDVVSSYLTEDDEKFSEEWDAIQKDREDPAKAKFLPGEDAGQDQGFRWRELKAMFRSLCRNNQFVQHASASVEWSPKA